MIWPGNLETIISTKILAIIIGLFTLIALNSILGKLKLEKKLKTITLLVSVPLILYFAFNFITPDLLVACLLLYYFNFLIDDNYRRKLHLGLFTGFVGGMAFLAKSYVFFFFLVHFTLTNILYLRKFSLDRIIIQRNLLLGLSVFLVISGIWIGIISEKYDTVTVGTSGSYNYAIVGPASQGQFMYYHGLIKPPNELAVSSWEDPSYFQLEKWNPLDSTENLNYQLRIIVNNVRDLIQISFNLLLISILVILISLFLVFKSREKSTRTNILLILGTIIIYLGGYSLNSGEGLFVNIIGSHPNSGKYLISPPNLRVLTILSCL